MSGGSDIRTGFTTKTLESLILDDALSFDELCRRGAEIGFDFVEIRDFDGNLDAETGRRFADQAMAAGLHPMLAWDGESVLSGAGEETWFDHIEMAARFPKPRYCRVTLAPGLVVAGGYGRADFDRLRERLRPVLETAVSRGVGLALENSFERLWVGDESSSVGFAEAVEQLPSCRVCFDPTNLVVNAGESPAEARAAVTGFLDHYEDRIAYIHLKSSIAGTLRPELVDDADIPPTTVVSAMQTGARLCMELPNQPSLHSAMARLAKANAIVETLRRGGSN